MLKIFLYALICCMALYGLIQMVTRWLNRYIPSESKEIKTPYTVLAVKNQEDSIEATIRSTVWHMLSQSRSRYINDLIVVDLGSTDETLTILKSLEREYEFIHPMSKERYMEFVENL